MAYRTAQLAAFLISYLLIGVTLLPSMVNAQTCNNVTLPVGVSVNIYNVSNCVGRNVRVGGTCTVTCGPWYTGSTRIFTCQGTTSPRWVASSFPTCTGRCQALSAMEPADAKYNYTECTARNVGTSTCRITCGLGLSGASTANSCLMNATTGLPYWSKLRPTCGVQCPAIMLNSMQQQIYSSTCGTAQAASQTCTVACRPGFVGTSMSKTCTSGSASNAALSPAGLPTCTPTCAALVLTAAQSKIYNHTCTSKAPGDTCTLSCQSGYVGTPLIRRCTQINTTLSSWTPTTFPQCTATCAALTTINPATHVTNCSTMVSGSTCSVACKIDPTIARTYKCLYNSTLAANAWSGSLPLCPASTSCAALTATNSAFNVSDCGAKAAGSTCVLSCAANAATNATYTCAYSAAVNKYVWTGTAPTCSVVSASWPPVPKLRPWQNKAWCPQVDNLPEICQNNILTTSYLPNEIITVDFDTPATTIATLKSKGYFVVCYASAGTKEPWRADASLIPAEVVGWKMSGWDEWWLDIRPTNPKYPALQAVMENRAKTLAQNGCQAIEWDNVDCWSNKCVSDQAAGTLTMKNAQYVYNKWLADVTHKYSMAVGLKNDIDQIADLVGFFDFSVNEACVQYNECDGYKLFTTANKAVLMTEYEYSSVATICNQAIANQWTRLYAVQNTWAACPLTSISSSSSMGLAPPAPVNGGWSEWDTTCSAVCNGVQARTCTNPRPMYGGKDCEGQPLQYCSAPASGVACPPPPAVDTANCWNITAPLNGFVEPSSVAQDSVVRFWCAPGYERVGFAKYSCEAGQLSGYATCRRMSFFAHGGRKRPFERGDDNHMDFKDQIPERQPAAPLPPGRVTSR